ncbi:unnamed protein product [Paramecium sonneborni]|uniref:Uncharacterized protein n=1 Tax=Paramecium sonneborni TaxID=65129 RepID=A0A8S1RQ00_9CILI|nr:unnamed protein product [Paramecium sonneborni]
MNFTNYFFINLISIWEIPIKGLKIIILKKSQQTIITITLNPNIALPIPFQRTNKQISMNAQFDYKILLSEKIYGLLTIFQTSYQKSQKS